MFHYKTIGGIAKNKIKQKQKLKPLSEATSQEMDRALVMAGLWVSTELEGRVPFPKNRTVLN